MPLFFGLGMLVLMALAILLSTLLSRKANNGEAVLNSGSEPYNDAQRDFYRLRRAELQRDLDAGVLDQSQFFELCRELDYQMVSEGGPKPSQNTQNKTSGRGTALIWLTMVMIPLIAGVLYWQLGYHRELGLKDLQQTMIERGEFDPALMAEMVERVDGVLAQRPDNPELLVMMAGIRRQQGDYAAAIPYYERLLDLYPKDSNVIAQLAQARYLANNRRLNKDIRDLLDRALGIDPNQGTALGVYGIDAFARGDYLAALDYWSRLSRQLPPQSAEASVIASGMAEAKSRAIAAGDLTGLGISVTVDASLGQAPAGVLFVVAKSGDGNPMPVAALRQPLNKPDWPQNLWLTDLDVIRQGQGLADFSSLTLSAHISRAGTAMRQDGDWTSDAIAVDPNATPDGAIELKLDRRYRTGD